MELYEKIKKERVKRKISQNEIAKHLNITISGYSMKETGKRAITTRDLETISEVLNVSPSIFFENKIHVKWN